MDYLKKILPVAAFMISFLSCNAQIQDKSGILFKETVYQLGVVKEGSNTLCIFSFTNKSKTALVITDVKAYCGCVKLNWTKEPVKPGDSGKIKVNFYAGNAGTFSKTIKVFTNINKQSIDLTLKGSVSVESGRE